MAQESSIALSNKNWVSRKCKYEKVFKLGGDPEIMIDREVARPRKESSAEANEIEIWGDYEYCV